MARGQDYKIPSHCHAYRNASTYYITSVHVMISMGTVHITENKSLQTKDNYNVLSKEQNLVAKLKSVNSAKVVSLSSST